MSERGVFAVDRGIWDHPMFQSKEPFSRREAWLWLLSEAAWKPKTIFAGGVKVKLERGQLSHSVRFLAEKWGWSKSSVGRFLDALKTDTMVGTESGTGQIVITICNYGDYQKVSLPDRDADGTESGTVAGQQRDKEENIQTIEKDSVAIATAAGAAPMAVYSDSKHELWGEGVPILGQLGLSERSARSNIGRWLKDAKDDAQLVLGAIQRARDHRVIDPIPWITRAIGAKNGSGYTGAAADRSTSAAAGRLLEKIRSFNAPIDQN